MRKLTAICLLAALCLGLLSGCAQKAAASGLSAGLTPNPVEGTADLEKSGGYHDFALNLLRNVMAAKPEDPLVSPLSVISALALLTNGAEAESLQQLETALGMTREQLNLYLYTYAQGAGQAEGASLHMANGVWFRDDPELEVGRDFLQANVDYLDAGTYKAPFDSSTLNQINNWVKENTRGMIPSLLNEMPQDAMMILVNALAFEGKWSTSFKSDAVKKNADFTLEDGTRVPVDLMYDRGSNYRYLELPNATGFLKNYQGFRYAFLGLLPQEGVKMAEFLAGLEGSALADGVAGASSTRVNIAVPKFERSYDASLVEALEQMGITDVFTPGADLAPMGTYQGSSLMATQVAHKTYISLDEVETKAAAVTGIVAAPSSAPIVVEPKEVYLDRPFVYAIWDLEANIPVFLGVYTQP